MHFLKLNAQLIILNLDIRRCIKNKPYFITRKNNIKNHLKKL